MNVIEFARRTEESGARFYQEMSDRATEPGIKRIFSNFAHDEVMLLEKLQRMQEKHPEITRQESSMLNKRVNPFEKLRKKEDKIHVSTDVEAYQVARDAERDVLRAYEKAAKAANETELKIALTRIAALEQQELTEIEGLLDFTSVPNQSLVWGEFSNLDEFHDFGRYGQG